MNCGALLRRLLVAWLVAGSGAASADWVKAETKYFNLYVQSGFILFDAFGNLGTQAKIERHARELDRFYESVLHVLGVSDDKLMTGRRLDVLIYQDEDRVRTIANGVRVDGLYVQCAEGAVAFMTKDSQKRTLFHEVAHRIMFQLAAGYYPFWFVEGFAEYMSGTTVSDDAVVFGNVPTGTEDVLRNWRWVDFEDLLQDTRVRGLLKEKAHVVYAQSWLLTHYMLADRERAARFFSYFDKVAGGGSALNEFEKALGHPAAELKPRLLAYFGQAKGLRLATQAGPALVSKPVRLAEEQAKGIVASLELRACPAPTLARAILKDLRQEKSSQEQPNAALRLALARAELIHGDPATALAELDLVLAQDADNFEAHYLKGRGLSKQAANETGEVRQDMLDEARDHLVRAYELNKQDAPNLYALAREFSRSGEPDRNTLNAARGARSLEPTVREYAMFAAVLEVHMAQRERAIRALRPLESLASHGSTDADAFARKVQRAINAIKTYASAESVAKILWGE